MDLNIEEQVISAQHPISFMTTTKKKLKIKIKIKRKQIKHMGNAATSNAKA